MRAALSKFWDGDLAWSWRHTPVAIVATLTLLVMLIAAFGADWIAPHNPFDLATIELLDALKPPVWADDGTTKYLLGTDSQGRDLLSALMYGTKVSLLIGLAAVAGAMLTPPSTLICSRVIRLGSCLRLSGLIKTNKP